MVSILVLFLILKAPCLNFFLLHIIPAVDFWYIDSMEVRKFPSVPSLLGFYYKQVLVLHVLIPVICKNGHLAGFVRAA